MNESTLVKAAFVGLSIAVHAVLALYPIDDGTVPQTEKPGKTLVLQPLKPAVQKQVEPATETEKPKTDPLSLSMALAMQQIEATVENIKPLEKAPPIPKTIGQPKKKASKAAPTQKTQPAKAAESPADPDVTAPQPSTPAMPPAPQEQGTKETSPKTTASGLPAGNGANMKTYKAMILQAIASRPKTYPKLAKKLGIEGASEVSFTIDAKGEIIGTVVVSSAPHPSMDDEATRLVAQAGPFPLLPPTRPVLSSSP